MFEISSELGSPLTFLSASAGTGKTYSICKKLVYLFVDPADDKRFLPQEVAIITFTNNAARELKSRIQKFLVDEEEFSDFRELFKNDAEKVKRNRQEAVAHLNEASIGTIHHFCTEILRIVGVDADFDLGRQLTADVDDLVAQAENAAMVKACQSSSFMTQEVKDGGGYQPSDYENTLSVVRQNLNPKISFGYVASNEADAAVQSAWTEWATDFRDFYELLERINGIMSNDSLLYLTRKAIEGANESQRIKIAELLRKRWKLVMVDEFQDTDIDQWAIIKKGFIDRIGDIESSKVIVVGDGKQSIYAFRGANISNFEDARQLSEQNQNRSYELTINYRSDKNVTDVVNMVVPYLNMGLKSAYTCVDSYIEKRNLRECGRNIKEGLFVRNSEGLDKNNLPDDVAKTIQYLLNNLEIFNKEKKSWELLKLSDIAILVRTRDKAKEIVSGLRKSHINGVFTGSLSVFRESAAEAWLDVLNAVLNPLDRSLLKKVSVGPFGSYSPHDLMIEGIIDVIIKQWLTYTSDIQQGGFAVFWENLKRSSCFEQRVFEHEYGEDFYIDALQIEDWLQNQWNQLQDFQRLVIKLQDKIIAARNGSSTPEDEEKRRIPTDSDVVQVYTYHASKGLQFPIVLLPYLASDEAKDRVNQTYAHTYLPKDDTTGDMCRGLYFISKDNEDEDCESNRVNTPSAHMIKERLRVQTREENARIAYVAFTRAELLNIVWTKDEDTNTALGVALNGDAATSNDSSKEALDGALTSLQAQGLVRTLEFGEEDLSNKERESVKIEEPLELSNEFIYKRISSSNLPSIKFRTSYSGISSNLKRDVDQSTSGVDDDDTDSDNNVDLQGSSFEALLAQSIKEVPVDDSWYGEKLLPETHPLIDLDAGTSFGLSIHTAFENLINIRRECTTSDLHEACTCAAKKTLTNAVLRDEFHEVLEDLEAQAVLTQMLEQTFSVKINGPFEGKSFSDFGPKKMRAELEFDFQLVAEDSRTLSLIASVWKKFVRRRDLVQYANQLNHKYTTLQGIMTGSIDVLLQDNDGNYYIADWKTNNLTSKFGRREEINDPKNPEKKIMAYVPRRYDYCNKLVTEDMKEANYLLQALIYSVAVYRITGKAPKGVAYLFVRGMGDQAKSLEEEAPGVFTWSIPKELVIETNNILLGGVKK